jgi:hypothetical protein
MGKETRIWFIIEANSLLDRILERDNNIRYIIDFADEGKIEIKTSEISWEEIESALFGEVMYHRKLALELEKRSKDLRRGRYTEYGSLLNNTADSLKALSREIEQKSRRDIEKLKTVIDTLPFNGDILAEATKITFNPLFGLKLADAVHFVVAKNTAALKPDGVECIFFTKDKHFDNDLIRKELMKSGVLLYTKSGECVKFLRKKIINY